MVKSNNSTTSKSTVNKMGTKSKVPRLHLQGYSIAMMNKELKGIVSDAKLNRLSRWEKVQMIKRFAGVACAACAANPGGKPAVACAANPSGNPSGKPSGKPSGN